MVSCRAFAPRFAHLLHFWLFCKRAACIGQAFFGVLFACSQQAFRTPLANTCLFALLRAPCFAFAKTAEGKKISTLLDLCVSSLRRGHANLLCIVPILTDDPRRESNCRGCCMLRCIVCRRRPYRVECTGSLSTSEVKRRRARSVLGWGTAREDLRVLSAFHVTCYLQFFQEPDHCTGSV